MNNYSISQWLRWLFISVVALGSAATTYAQTSIYTNTTTNIIDASTTCGSTPFTRVFTVPGTDDFTVADLDLGFFATHTWRGDIQLDLTSPSATTVRLIEVVGAGSQDNYNIEMDDAASTLINTGTHGSSDGTTPPLPYENQVRPDNALSAFNGENSVGNWTMTICDEFAGADDGVFQRADLFFTHAVPGADLSMAIAANDTTPDTGTNVILTYTIANAGPDGADDVSATISLPTGLSYVSDNGAGAFSSGTGLWIVPGTIGSGGNTSLQITAFVELSGAYGTSAEVTSSNLADPDSTPGNSNTGEDDYDALTLVPTTPPVASLTCPAAASVLDWDSQSWTIGSLSNSYTIDGENISVTVADPNTLLITDPVNGGQTPLVNTTLTGGYSPMQSNLFLVADPPDQNNIVDLNLALGTFGTGVEKFQMTVFDVDFGTSQFQDELTINGTLNGVGVTPIITTGVSNSVSGNVVTGTGTSDLTSGNGNLTIQFNAPIDTLVVNYANGPTSPVNPGVLGIGFHDIYFCPPTTAVLSAQKTTEVYDPTSAGLYAIPGNDIIYTIEFTNTGDGAADTDSVTIIDAMPPEVEFYNGDIDDGGPETDPVIGIDDGSGLTLTYATDVAYSTAGTKPTNFAACTDNPVVGYDPNITYICINPKGAMAAGDPDPSYQLLFRARIK